MVLRYGGLLESTGKDMGAVPHRGIGKCNDMVILTQTKPAEFSVGFVSRDHDVFCGITENMIREDI